MNLKAVQNEDDCEILDTGWMKFKVKQISVKENEPREKTKEELEEELSEWFGQLDEENESGGAEESERQFQQYGKWAQYGCLCPLCKYNKTEKCPFFNRK